MPQDSEKYMSEDQSGTDIEKNADRDIYPWCHGGENYLFKKTQKNDTGAACGTTGNLCAGR